MSKIIAISVCDNSRHMSVSPVMDMEKDDQREFKKVLQAFLRNYAFIIQVVRMMDKDIQEKYIYCKYYYMIMLKVE